MNIEGDTPKITILTPEQARNQLEDMGLEDQYWDRFLRKDDGSGKWGSHELAALITIARGSEPQPFEEVYNQMRLLDGEKPIAIERIKNRLSTNYL
jgi:hypothetical protein